jgi:hypothetical protein
VSAKINEWPAGIERPPWHGSFAVSHPLGELIRDAFVPWTRPGSPAPTSAAFTDRLFGAAEKAAGFAAAMQAADAQIIADLKNPAPQSNEERVA